jgi:hypothetical protein
MLQPFERRHAKVLSTVIAAMFVAAQARSLGIASVMARWTSIRLDSALNRFYRLLRNRRVEDSALAEQLLRHVSRGGEVLLAVDWTEWHSGLRMLVAGAVVGHRAVPIFARAFGQLVRNRSQNTRENHFARELARLVHEVGVKATVLCDRGFRRVSWLELLDKLDLCFVVRLMDDVSVDHAGSVAPLSTLGLRRGRVLDLGRVALRQDGAVRARVIGYWAPGAKEPWWIATNSDLPASRVLALYDRRMTVEECFRDTKGQRFGAKLGWTRFRDPDKLARFVHLLAVALLMWLLTGLHAARRDRSLRMTCKVRGPRQSYVTIGLRFAAIDEGPLITPALLELLPAPALRRIAGYRRGGK